MAHTHSAGNEYHLSFPIAGILSIGLQYHSVEDAEAQPVNSSVLPVLLMHGHGAPAMYSGLCGVSDVQTNKYMGALKPLGTYNYIYLFI